MATEKKNNCTKIKYWQNQAQLTVITDDYEVILNCIKSYWSFPKIMTSLFHKQQFQSGSNSFYQDPQALSGHGCTSLIPN